MGPAPGRTRGPGRTARLPRRRSRHRSGRWSAIRATRGPSTSPHRPLDNSLQAMAPPPRNHPEHGAWVSHEYRARRPALPMRLAAHGSHSVQRSWLKCRYPDSGDRSRRSLDLIGERLPHPPGPAVRRPRPGDRVVQRAGLRCDVQPAEAEPVRRRGTGRHGYPSQRDRGFRPPATSYASVIVTVPELEQLHDSFKEGLRASFGKVPVNTIPRAPSAAPKGRYCDGFQRCRRRRELAALLRRGRIREGGSPNWAGPCHRRRRPARRRPRRRGPRDRWPRCWVAALPQRARCRTGRGTGLPRRTSRAPSTGPLASRRPLYRRPYGRRETYGTAVPQVARWSKVRRHKRILTRSVTPPRWGHINATRPPDRRRS